MQIIKNIKISLKAERAYIKLRIETPRELRDHFNNESCLRPLIALNTHDYSNASISQNMI